MIGADNFSQISQETILRYQRQTFGFDIVSNSELKKDLEHFIWIIGGLPISYIIEEIKEFKPHYVFIETTYMEEINLIDDLYEIDFFNEVIIILKKKNESSIQEFFKHSRIHSMLLNMTLSSMKSIKIQMSHTHRSLSLFNKSQSNIFIF